MSKKAWGGRFAEGAAPESESFTASLPFDQELYAEDIAGSLAHVTMLGRQAILPLEDVTVIQKGLKEILAEIEAGNFPFRLELEDIHLNIERRLIEKIGPVGGKLHTGRSRNDQVALDEHLYLKRVARSIDAKLKRVQEELLHLSEEHLGVIMPGYTHLQRAQPILFSHHLLAYFFMLERDRGRLLDLVKRANWSPLGAAALAGTPFPIDRKATSDSLGFTSPYPNSLDAVSDRDYFLEFLSFAAIHMAHISRLAEEFILWSSKEFDFIELSDRYATGSSIMPQKKNPDTAEIMRGKTGRVYGNLMALLTVVKGIALAYHSDLQEDKERVFDTVKTLEAVLDVLAGMLATLTVKKERLKQAVLEDFATATDLADDLAAKGVPFREAHEVVGGLVLRLIREKRLLSDLTVTELNEVHPLFDEKSLAKIRPEVSVQSRTSEGGTAQNRVQEEIHLAKSMLLSPHVTEWLDQK